MQRFSLLARRPPSDAQLTGSSSLKLRIPISKVFVCICSASMHSAQNGFARRSKRNLDVEPGQRKLGGQPNERERPKVYSDPSLVVGGQPKERDGRKVYSDPSLADPSLALTSSRT